MIEHIPVLLDEIIKYLDCMGNKEAFPPTFGRGQEPCFLATLRNEPSKLSLSSLTLRNKVIVDCTIGEGGHAEKILENLGSSGILLGIDQDQDALVAARKRLASFGERVILTWDNFTNLEKILREKGIEKIDGILFDLGISSLQLNRRDRGFSFLKEGPLDMRMNKAQKINASELINKTSYKELQNIIYELGEKRWARRIARAIVREREKGPVTTTTQLARIIERAVPYRGRIHPATRAFQALRIKVNRELENLKEILPQAVDSLRKGGRICIVSYHSLEDRIVKNSFKEFARQGRIEILTKKPIISQEEEIRMNPRSRSAKLRAGERV